MARGVCQPGPNGSADGAMVGHGSSVRLERLGAFPGPLRRRLAAGMRELDAEFRAADALAVEHDAPERILAGIGIDAEAAMGDAAVALDMGRFEHQEARAGIGQHAEMGHVPVVADAVIGAVLAHRRDDDAVRQCEIGKFDRREQSARHCGSHSVGVGKSVKRNSASRAAATLAIWVSRCG